MTDRADAAAVRAYRSAVGLRTREVVQALRAESVRPHRPSCHVAKPVGPSTRVNSPVSGSHVTSCGTKRPERRSKKGECQVIAVPLYARSGPQYRLVTLLERVEPVPKAFRCGRRSGPTLHPTTPVPVGRHAG